MFILYSDNEDSLNYCQGILKPCSGKEDSLNFVRECLYSFLAMGILGTLSGNVYTQYSGNKDFRNFVREYLYPILTMRDLEFVRKMLFSESV